MEAGLVKPVVKPDAEIFQIFADGLKQKFSWEPGKIVAPGFEHPFCDVSDVISLVPVFRECDIGFPQNLAVSCADGIGQYDFSVLKRLKVTEKNNFTIRADFFNLTNTRNFGIPESRVNSANFLNQWGQDGGNRRIQVSARYTF